MDLELSDEQQMFFETTRKFLTTTWPTSATRKLIGDPKGFDRGVWRQGAELGWTSMLVPEEHGGGSISGNGVADLAIVIEELGRFLVPSPVLPTNIVAFALAASESAQLAAEHLPALAAGTEIATWAVAEGGDGWGAEAVQLEAVESGGGFTLNGVKSPVPDAAVADHILVAARTDEGVAQFLVPTATQGVSVTGLESLDLARRFARVRFEGAQVPAAALVSAPGRGQAAVERQLALAAALVCAETVGAADRAYEITLEYTKDRKSFGRPIGSYQALKHRLVDMLLWLESSKAATVAATTAVGLDVGASEAASVAKAYVSDRCPVILRECLQLHGGIGFTWEHDIHLYLRRVESDAALFGGPDYHRDRLAAAAGFSRPKEHAR